MHGVRMTLCFPSNLGFSLTFAQGVPGPCPTALQVFNVDVLSIDILLDSRMDLLDAGFYKQLLFLCGSGIVGYAAASPSCAEYSRLKLQGGPPFALRTPEFLDGLPDLLPEDFAKVQVSHAMFGPLLPLRWSGALCRRAVPSRARILREGVGLPSLMRIGCPASLRLWRKLEKDMATRNELQTPCSHVREMHAWEGRTCSDAR